MERTHQIVLQHREKAQIKQEKYNQKAKAVKISMGDKVLVKRLAFDGKHKIADRFESEPYLVIQQPRPGIPIFKLRSQETDRERTLHQNHLLLIDDQDDKTDEDDEGEGNRPVDDDKIDDRTDASKEKEDEEKGNITEVIEESDSECDFGYKCA